jgi:hypothetical protein
MNNKAILSALAVITLNSTMASAETNASTVVDGTVHFSFGAGNIGSAVTDQDARSLNFSLESNVHLSEQFKIGVDISHNKLTVETVGGIDFDFATTRFSVMPTYSFGNGYYAGLYLQDARISALTASVNLESYGALAGYVGDNFSVEGYAGRTSLGTNIGAQIDADNIGFIGTLKPTEDLQIFAHYSLANINGAIGTLGDASFAAIGAEYGFGSGWSMFGAFSSADQDGNAAPIRQSSVGVSYDLSERGMPGTLSLDWSRTDYGFAGLEQDMVSLGWTIPFGGAVAAPRTCTMNNARGKNRAAFSATIECAPVLGAS